MNNNITVTTRLFFNDKAEFINFISKDRDAVDNGKQYHWANSF